MKKTKPILAVFLFLLLLNACGGVAEGLSGSKKKGNEEFLVEKKAPLVLPPNFGQLPEPGAKKDENEILTEENDLSIEDMFNQSSSTETRKDSSNSSIEKSIIDKINE
jgi:hypothetical protein